MTLMVGRLCWKINHLVSFHESVLVSLFTFQPTVIEFWTNLFLPCGSELFVFSRRIQIKWKKLHLFLHLLYSTNQLSNPFGSSSSFVIVCRWSGRRRKKKINLCLNYRSFFSFFLSDGTVFTRQEGPNELYQWFPLV